MRTLVTGGAGFIGSHLVDRLLKDGHSVVVMDNFVTGRMSNLESHKNNRRLKVVECDIGAVSRRMSSHFDAIDWVFHLAARADIVPSITNPLEYHASNVDGTFNVLEAVRKNGVKRFVYAASSSCYGIPDLYPTPETAPIRPQYPYALTKNIGETYALTWAKIYGVPAISLRFFNVYGPRSRTTGTYGAVFGVFLAQKLKGLPYTVVGDGTQRRDFTYVSDVVDALIKASESDISGEVFNVGSGKTVSINTLVRLLGGEVVHIPKRPGEPDKTFADIRKIQKTLKWRPKVTFEKGVRILLTNIDYFKDAPVWTKEKIREATKEWFRYLSKEK